MTGVQKLSWVAVLLSCAAAMVQPYTDAVVPFVLFMGCIAIALVIMMVGLWISTREWRELQEAVELHDRWRKQRARSR
jgi:membrane protein YdbS with pleckstrin-like domain